MRRLLLLLMILALSLNLAFATTKTVGEEDCDYENLKEAIAEVNNTNTSIAINSPGEYSMNTSSYQINTTNKAIHINSSDVNIDCNDSVIKGNSSGKGIYATGENITLKNCHIKNFSSRGLMGEHLYNSSINNTKIEEITGKAAKGIYLNTADNNLIIDSTIEKIEDDGVLINEGHNNSIINSQINGDNNNIKTTSEGDNYVINSTFEKEDITPMDSSTLFVMWYIQVSVIDDSANEIEEADVDIFDREDEIIGYYETNEQGEIFDVYPEFFENESSRYNFNNYSIIAFNETHYGKKEINLTESKDVQVALNLTRLEGYKEEFTTDEKIELEISTNKKSNYSIDFAKKGGETLTFEKQEFEKEHNLTIDGLNEKTKYNYNITICDKFNYCLKEGPFNVTTNATWELVPPEISFIKPKEDNTTIYDRWINQEIKIETSEPSECEISDIGEEIDNSFNLIESTLEKSDNNKTHSIKFNATDDGDDFFVNVSCTDNYNNEKSKQVNFSVNDTTKPYLSFMDETIDNREYTNNENITFYIESEEGLDDDYPLINLNEEENHSMNYEGDQEYNYTFSELEEGEHTVKVYARDKKGNLRERSRTFTTDYTPPEMEIKVPEDNQIFQDTNIVEANITLDEKGECEYELFYLEQEELDECIEECEDEEEDCMDDAETTEEEDECEDELDECIEECEEDKYSEEEDEEIDLYMDIDDCKDNCDNKEDKCIKECEEERDSCFELYADDTVCYEDYDDCQEDCEEETESCYDDCEEMDFTYLKVFEEHFNDGDYLFKFVCEDKAGNEVRKNSTFNVNDITPPEILRTAPNGTINDTPVDLTVRTDDLSICRYSQENISFERMNKTFGKIGKYHTQELEGLSEGKHEFYVNCNDTNGNIMEENEKIKFDLLLNDEEKTEEKKLLSKSFDRIDGENASVFSITEDEFSTREFGLKTNESVEDVEIKLEEMDEQELVDNPKNKVYNFFTISKKGVKNEQIENINITFRVKNSWLDDNNIGRVFLEHYKDSWQEKTTTELNEEQNYTYYIANVSSLSMFSISGEEREEEETEEEDAENETRDEVSEIEEHEAEESPEENETEEEPEVDQPEEIEPLSFDLPWSWIFIGILIAGVLVVGGGAAAFFVYRPSRHPQQDLKNAAVQEQPTQTETAADTSAAVSPSSQETEKRGIGYMDEKKETQKETDEETKEAKNDKDPLIKYALESYEKGMGKDEIMNSLIEKGQKPLDAQEILIKAGLTKDEVKEYITKAIEAGQNEDFIKGALLRNGFDEEYVEKKIDEAKSEYVETEFQRDAEKKQKMKEDRLKKALEDYVKNAIDTGLTHEEVRKVLLDMGHSFKDVDNAIGKVEEKKEPNQNESKKENEKNTGSESEVDRELIDYVKQCMDSDLSQFHIKKILKDAGYEKKEIKEALDIAKKEKE